MPEVSQRPYLIRAMHAWMTDNGWTPQILVDASAGDPILPEGVLTDGRVVLNVSYDATRELELGDDAITFNARFSGTPFVVLVPVECVAAIFARENQRGMGFALEGDDSGVAPTELGGQAVDGEGDEDPDDEPPSPPRPKLRVVK